MTLTNIKFLLSLNFFALNDVKLIRLYLMQEILHILGLRIWISYNWNSHLKFRIKLFAIRLLIIYFFKKSTFVYYTYIQFNFSFRRKTE